MSSLLRTVRVNALSMTDWESFHDEFSRAFGFPGYYGRNMNAWIDCMTSLDEEMSDVQVEVGQFVMLEIEHLDVLEQKQPELAQAIYECSAFVNGRRVNVGHSPILFVSSFIA